MRPSFPALAFGFLLGLGMIGCGMSLAGEKEPAHNVCPLPSIRDVRVSPQAADAGWMDAILYAFDRWKEVVPGLAFNIRVTDEASEITLPCVTSIVMYDFEQPEYDPSNYAETKNGFIRLSLSCPFTADGRRAMLLHELGHLLFGFGHTTDMTSIMYPIIQDAPRLSAQDEANARAAFLLRDGAGGAS